MDFKGFLGVLGTLRDFSLTQLCTNFVLVTVYKSSLKLYSDSQFHGLSVPIIRVDRLGLTFPR